MRKLLIVSDSHGEFEKLKELIYNHKDFYCIHLGDYCISDSVLDEMRICYVKGNCDFSRAEAEKILNIDENIIFMTHGHKYNVKSTYVNIYYKALECKARYCLFGHTHREVIFEEDGIIFINPGSFRDTGSYVEIIDDKVVFKRM
ncbi:MAG: metallophosphoesterase family protein [Anaeroplasmataceae bacterium]